VKNLISPQKFSDILQNFVIFPDTKFRKISQNKKLFREIGNKYFAKFPEGKISSTTLFGSH
jgi:hypothetical protein